MTSLAKIIKVIEVSSLQGCLIKGQTLTQNHSEHQEREKIGSINVIRGIFHNFQECIRD